MRVASRRRPRLDLPQISQLLFGSVTLIQIQMDGWGHRRFFTLMGGRYYAAAVVLAQGTAETTLPYSFYHCRLYIETWNRVTEKRHLHTL